MPDARGVVAGRGRSRREFVRGAMSLATLAALPAGRELGAGGALFSPLGYAAITWQGEDEQAIADIASLGFRGIQLRATAVERWGARPQELRRLLGDKRLSLTCLSSGTVDADPARRQEYLDTHAKHAAFVRDVGGNTLQILSRRPKDRAPTPEEFTRLGALLTDLGRRAQDVGVRLVYHNHMNAFGESPDEVARVLDATDARFVSLLLDIAHYKQGGGDPVAAVGRHERRLALVHLKDVISPVPGDTRPPRESYQWVELGRGSVDVPGVIAALRKASYRGPAVIELDRVTSPEKTPRECAAANKKYAVETLGLTL